MLCILGYSIIAIYMICMMGLLNDFFLKKLNKAILLANILYETLRVTYQQYQNKKINR